MILVIPDAATVTNGDIDLSCFCHFGQVITYPTTKPEDLPARIQDADIVLCNKAQMSASVINAAPHLSYIGLFATGYNNIDLNAARARKIVVCNAGTYSTDAVAQLVFAFLLHNASKVDKYNNFVQHGSWIQSQTFSPFVFGMTELAGKTLGIFGFGSIGKTVAGIANAFGMKVIVTTRTEKPEEEFKYRVKFVSFDELLASSDYLTIHCPLTEKTAGLFDASAFKKMKQGSYLINTSRGGVLSESALADAVKSGHLSGAAVDVLQSEPMAPDCLLLGIPEITITPHIAWAPSETRKRLIKIVYDNIAAYLAGHPEHVVS